MHIDPQAAQFAQFADEPGARPLFMLNLLRFKERADGSLDGEDVSGATAYARYAAAVARHLERVGGSLLWAGACSPALIGPAEGEWDMVAVVKYPSRAAFLEMVTDAEYLKVSELRTAALADSRLIPCAQVPVV